MQRSLSCLASVLLILMAPQQMSAADAPEPLTAGLEFDGSSGQVVLDSGFSLAQRSFTVEAWVWLNDTAGDQTVLGQLNGGGNPMHLVVRDGRVHLGFWADDLTGATNVPVQEWVHVAYSYDQATRIQRVFLNGQADGSRTADAPFAENNEPLRIGVWFANEFFNGRMLELRIWDHARSEAAIAADRFLTPPIDAPGLEALFTFEGVVGANLPEATDNLVGNTIVGGITVAAPVLAPARLNDTMLTTGVPVGSLAAALAGYTVAPAPTAPFSDPGGSQLSDGLVPLRAWGSPWLDFSDSRTDSLLAWQGLDPQLTFYFAERVRIDAITLYAANSDGDSGFATPTAVHIESPGGYSASLPVVAAADTGAMQAIELSNLGLLTDQVSLTLTRGSEWLALGEVQFEGAVLAERAAPGASLPLLIQRFTGVTDASALGWQVDSTPSEVIFRFPQADDTFGVQAEVLWSTDLRNWQPLPHEAAPQPGERIARLSPLPTENRAFFRLRLSTDMVDLQTPADVNLLQNDTPFNFPAGALLGTTTFPAGPEGLSIAAINDRTASVGQPIALDFGGSLQIEADGSGTLSVPSSMPGGANLEATFSYTVINRLGETDRRSFALSIAGENDAPTVAPITLSHSSGVVDAGVAYRYFEGNFPDEASLLAATAATEGRQPTFSLAPAAAASGGFALELTGELFVPAAGPYTFYLVGNNASVLDVGGTRVVAHDPANSAAERSGTVELAAGSHTVRLRYFDITEPAAQLSVEYSGPGFVREPIRASAFPRLTAISLDPLTGASDPDTGDVLTVSQINGQPISAGSPVVLATGAEIQLNGDGTLTFQPAPGRTVLHEATDTESFSYTVSDGGGLSATATAFLELARVNSAPVSGGPVSLNVNTATLSQIPASDAANDPDGDDLLITHVNGEPLVGGSTRSLPSTARVSLSTGLGSPLDYDGKRSFLRTLSQSSATDAFSITLTDAAGGTVEVEITANVLLWVDDFISYADSRFARGVEFGLGPRSVRLGNRYRSPVEMVTYVTDRETGLHYGHSTHTVPSDSALLLHFDVPPGIDLEGGHFFDRFDLEVDTVTGDPIHYQTSLGGGVNDLSVQALYSTASKSFFRVTGAANPRMPLEIRIPAGRVPFASGVREISTAYGGFIDLYTVYALWASSAAQKTILEPTFASSIIVQGICRTAEISRFSIENRNDEAVPLTVGSSGQVFVVDPGQTRIIEVPYEPKVLIKVLEADLGLFDSNEAACPLDIDIMATPLCQGTPFSFVEVRNNNPTESFTVRIESIDFPSIRSDPQVIDNQASKFIELNTQGVNLGGTPGQVVIILPDQVIIGPTFIFSSDDC